MKQSAESELVRKRSNQVADLSVELQAAGITELTDASAVQFDSGP